ncbi:MAG: DNA segregation ATPase FtsK/SpoIIIE [Thermodesulfobacterium sp.]|uniref:DNA segregation ATPase FtsK/SpoIIIE n=1 Tax=Candidatus Thermodesulfobacterium syntrophicum TaxID=3060442 RepID=A0AAE3TDP3_9BACT|nr:DNA segregation ATPase FtsK/SpoIIIE [Candidatus Thermodesulfobacterium syntrophicum]
MDYLKKFLIHISLFLLVFFLTLSIYSFNPYDPGIGVSGAYEVKNFGGFLGAYISSLVIFLFGFTALFIPPFFLLGIFAYFMGVSIKRLTGIFLFSLTWFSLILSFFFHNMNIKNAYLFEKYPLNGGLIGELSSLIIHLFGLFGFFLFLIFILIFILFLSFENPKDLFSKVKKIFKSEEESEIKKVESYEKVEAISKNSKPKTSEAKKQEVEISFPKKKQFPPPLELLNNIPEVSYRIKPEELKERASLLVSKLKEFGIEGEVVGINPGPVITVFEFKPAPGIKLSKILSLVDDLALGLSAKSVRIIAPIPGKDVVGIEISNPKRELVYLKEILESSVFKNSSSPLTIALGKDVSGNPVVTDLRKLPHLLIAGSTGSGKSIFLHSVILSLIYKSPPETIKFLMIDPKRIELSVYEKIPYLLHPVVLDPKTATKALRWLIDEMDRRYAIFEEVGARNLDSYNENFEEKLPYIIVIIDELADLMVVSSREVETLLTRLAQMARAAGIHLLVATQRPSVDIITGTIKVNFPARISFQVTTKVDSRTILDTQGAERLLGAGDMLFMPPGSSYLERIHAPYVSEKEVKKIVEYLKTLGEPEYLADFKNYDDEEGILEKTEDYDDELYEEALKIAYQYGKISVSMLQRKLRIGYNRAARLVEKMEEEGIVGPSDGVRPRPVLGPRKQF